MPRFSSGLQLSNSSTQTPAQPRALVNVQGSEDDDGRAAAAAGDATRE